jgi:hypothetical protein
MSPLIYMQVNFELLDNFKLKLKVEILKRICFSVQAFVDHLHFGCRAGKESNKQPAVHPILQQPKRSK